MITRKEQNYLFKKNLKLLENEYFKNYSITKENIFYKTTDRRTLKDFTDDITFKKILANSKFFIKLNGNNTQNYKYYTTTNAYLFLKQNLKFSRESFEIEIIE